MLLATATTTIAMAAMVIFYPPFWVTTGINSLASTLVFSLFSPHAVALATAAVTFLVAALTYVTGNTISPDPNPPPNLERPNGAPFHAQESMQQLARLGPRNKLASKNDFSRELNPILQEDNAYNSYASLSKTQPLPEFKDDEWEDLGKLSRSNSLTSLR